MRWTSVAYILERAAGRCTVRRTPATAGCRLCAICRRYIRSRCRRCERDTAAMIRVELPGHLRALAHVKGEVTVEVAGRCPCCRCWTQWKRSTLCCAERFEIM